jgi:Uma2 family endonuclease
MPAPEKNRRYTFADYLTWPEDERWEILNGVPVLQSAPSWQHQSISRELILEFGMFLRDKSCQVFDAPFDVRLPVSAEEEEDDVINVFQPDITVICDATKLKGSGYFGTPELVIEISSSSTGKMDKVYKFNTYEKAGVQEYWIVEPEGKTVMVFTLQEDGRYGRPQMYTEDDTITVNTIPDLHVDLKRVFKGI